MGQFFVAEMGQFLMAVDRKQRETPKAGRVGLSITLPLEVHRAAKVRCAALGVTWEEAIEAALTAWARERQPK